MESELHSGFGESRSILRTCPGFVLFGIACAFLSGSANALNPNSQISQYAHTAWRMQDGAISARASSFAQTTDGYLWIGTLAGLVRFDGVRFMPWTPPQGMQLPSVSIYSLLATSDGSLWIGTSLGLARWKDQHLTAYPNMRGAVLSLIEDHQKIVWATKADLVGRSASLCRITDADARCSRGSDGIPTSLRDAVVEDGEGYLWLADEQLLRWRAGSSTKYSLPGPRSNDKESVLALASGADDSIWVGLGEAGSGLGLQHLVGGIWKPFVTPQIHGSDIDAQSLFRDREGSIWVGTKTQGIYRINGDRIDRFDTADGLSGEETRGFFEDREGNLWVATAKGIDCFHENKIISYSMREGLAVPEVLSVLAARDGSIWVSGPTTLDALPHGNVPSIDYSKNIPPGQVRSLFEDRERRLWVAIGNDLFIYDHKSFNRVLRRDGSGIGVIDWLTEDKVNDIWMTVIQPSRSVLRLHEGKVQEEIKMPENSWGRQIAADPVSGIWLALSNSDLARFRDGKFETFHYEHSDPSRINQMIVNTDGSVLAATSFGLIGWRNGQLRTLSVRDGLPCASANAVVLDHQGDLWLFTECDLVKISKADLNEWWENPGKKISMRIFDESDGAWPGFGTFGPSAISPDGRLWFANNSLLQTLDPSHIPWNSTPPPVHIEQLVADDHNYPIQGNVALPPLTRDLEIDYTALSFVVPRKVRFRYKLDGWDKDWQDAETRRHAFYTNLAAGSYTFHVIACNNDGVWNETGSSLRFSITPTFYQTAWFKLLFAIAAGGLLWLIYFLRLSQATAKIKLRLNERVEERERIARELHDTLLQGFQGIVLRFQAVSSKLPAQEPIHAMLEKALERADEVMLEARQRVRGLRSEPTKAKDLPESLAEFSKDIALDSTASFGLTCIGKSRSLDPIVRDEAERISWEALSNAFRHSRASRIEAEVIYGHEMLGIRIRDNGIGIDPQTMNNGREGHWGLAGMRERAHTIGGKLDLWSNPNGGTEVELKIPATIAYPQVNKSSRFRKYRRPRRGKQEIPNSLAD